MLKNINGAARETKIFVGAAGWSYKDWVGVFYPPGTKPADMLSFYARFFNIIEVNATFYRYLPPEYVTGWIQKTEFREDMQFVLKLHADFTHKREYTNRELYAFRKNLDILAEQNKLNGLLIQFPYSFDSNTASIRYLSNLIAEFTSYRRFLEFRHSSWLNREIQEQLLLTDNTICSIDQPDIGKAVPFSIARTGKTAYVRLHGRNTEAWNDSIEHFGSPQTYEEQSERYNYLYNRGEVLEIVVRIKEMIQQMQEVVIITNNHPHGNAIINAFEFANFLKTKVGEEPPITTQVVMRKLGRIV